MTQSDGETCVAHEPCPACFSRDNLGRYDDGHAHCFGCGYHEAASGDYTGPQRRQHRLSDMVEGEPQAIPTRSLSEDTCRKWGYHIGTDESGRVCQIANYRDADGTLVAQKIRYQDKKFRITGDADSMGLYGQHLWKQGGRRVVLVEGEIDALSVSQCTGGTWPVASIPNGASNAKKAVQKALEWLASFESVVICFDMDEPGRKAAAECAALFPPGKCSIAEMPLKDPNEMLKADRVKELNNLLWQARVWTPGGIVNGAELWERITEVQQPGIEYPWKGLTAKTYGQRKGTLVTWTAGTGVGKSTILSKVAYDLAFKQGLRVGYVALEEKVGFAAQRFLSNHLGRLCHLPGRATEVEMRKAFDDTLASGRIWLFDHFGSADSDTLISKLRYLAVGCEVDAIILDHLSIAISGMGVDGDERRVIDYTVTALRTMVDDTGVLLHMISHLRRKNDGRSAEDGGKVSLDMLRGSHSIGQLSDQVIAVERDLQGEDSSMSVKVIKNRVSGDTGFACRLDYDPETGALNEVERDDDSDAEPRRDDTDF